MLFSMIKKAFMDSSFYFILLMELVWWAIYFKKYISIGIFVAVCLCLLKTEIKQEKWLLRCIYFLNWDSLYIKSIIQLFPVI